ncbi:hypothetical protein A6J80_13895 [Paracoccus yeei]|uniref:DUF58 domain-containing protein n=1 Tax=Paracoccus yeei TaxID=147645 RepID=A0A1V0GU25_9RHOB|nr:hypothetical protein [Paracoccus yeei]ARC37322.1 hypothetical protein A6J80_13895 [Paracoccus yeei]
MTPEAAELHLFDALAWRLSRALPGLHTGAQAGRMRGAGDSFADVAPLLAHPDPRRLDLRRSVTDPFGTLSVRRFQTRTDLRLHVLLDASASLAAGAGADRVGLARLLVAGFVQAARRGQDLFSLEVCCGDVLAHREPPSRRPGLGAELLAVLDGLPPQGQGIGALLAAAADLPSDRILVVLISDYDLAPSEVADLLASLRPRPVLPVWLRDRGLENPDPRFGLIDALDPETGRRRTQLATPRWAARQVAAARAGRAALRGVFAEHGLRPVEIADSIDVADLAARLDEAPL